MNMLYQHAKYMYPDSMMVFKCKTHSCRRGKQREVERAAKTTQQTPYKSKWQKTDEKLLQKMLKSAGWLGNLEPNWKHLLAKTGAEHSMVDNTGKPS